VQLRGVSFSGFESWAAFGGGSAPAAPSTAALLAWKVNAVRVPLNEAGWLGSVTQGMSGNTVSTPATTYQSAVQALVGRLTAAGIYVILDLHLSAPGKFAANVQNPMADSDNAFGFWTSVANTFKANPAVMFELFNEPYIFNTSVADGAFTTPTNAVPDPAANAIIRDGGTAIYYFGVDTGVYGGSKTRAPYAWRTAGFQPLINTIRATGATNVIVCGGNRFSSELTWWNQNPPIDPANQLAGAIHSYPSTWSKYPYNITAQTVSTDAMLAPVALNHPIIITELGDEVGSNPAPHATAVLAWADLHGYSVIAWTWNSWGGANTLIDSSGTPTAGLGQTYHDWSVNHK
jgi:endoglucanase